MSLTSILSKLPPVAFADNPFINEARTCRQFVNTDAPVVAIKRGELGFYPIYTPLSADELNESDGVTPAQREAMVFGSIFGFHVPGANPDRYDADGGLRRSSENEPESAGMAP